jgi:hypothetical protein
MTDKCLHSIGNRVISRFVKITLVKSSLSFINECRKKQILTLIAVRQKHDTS